MKTFHLYAYTCSMFLLLKGQGGGKQRIMRKVKRQERVGRGTTGREEDMLIKKGNDSSCSVVEEDRKRKESFKRN